MNNLMRQLEGLPLGANKKLQDRHIYSVNQFWNQGFTLIETLLYLSLFALVMPAVVTSSHQIIRSAGSLQGMAISEETAQFVISKIDGVLNGATRVSVEDDVLIVENASFQAGSDVFSFAFDNNSKAVILTLETGQNYALTPSAVSVAGIDFVVSEFGGRQLLNVQLSLGLASSDQSTLYSMTRVILDSG